MSAKHMRVSSANFIRVFCAKHMCVHSAKHVRASSANHTRVSSANTRESVCLTNIECFPCMHPQDLTGYKKFKNKQVSSSARGLIGLFRCASALATIWAILFLLAFFSCLILFLLRHLSIRAIVSSCATSAD